MGGHCCEAMAQQVNWSCNEHPEPFDCPDALVNFAARFQEYALIIHDGGRSAVAITFCPWCGRRLPDSVRDRWFEELDARGIDPAQDDVPAEFQDGQWISREDRPK